jgi:hypothetical protein
MDRRLVDCDHRPAWRDAADAHKTRPAMTTTRWHDPCSGIPGGMWLPPPAFPLTAMLWPTSMKSGAHREWMTDPLTTCERCDMTTTTREQCDMATARGRDDDSDVMWWQWHDEQGGLFDCTCCYWGPSIQAYSCLMYLPVYLRCLMYLPTWFAWCTCLCT